MKTIALTQGKVAFVDNEDFELVNQFKWCAKFDGRNWYAARGIYRPGRFAKTLRMHQFLMPGHPRIDHKNRNGLDNQRNNLRPAAHWQNVANAPKKGGDYKSAFKGVHTAGSRWRARIKADGKSRSLGCFDLEIDAARAYDAAARVYHGEFAHLNFP